MIPSLDPLPEPDPAVVARLRAASWLFLDVGETLLDESASWQEQFERLSLATRTPPSAKAVSVDELWTVFRAACAGFAPGQWKACCEACASVPGDVDRFLALGGGWRHDLQVPFPGVGDALATLATRYKLGVIANQSHGTRERLDRHGWLEHIRIVIGSAEAGVQKPDPKIFQMALAQANCAPDDAVMIGDRLDNDVAPANRLGMLSVHVRQGGSGAQRPRTADEVARVTVGSLPELTRMLV